MPLIILPFPHSGHGCPTMPSPSGREEVGCVTAVAFAAAFSLLAVFATRGLLVLTFSPVSFFLFVSFSYSFVY